MMAEPPSSSSSPQVGEGRWWARCRYEGGGAEGEGSVARAAWRCARSLGTVMDRESLGCLKLLFSSTKSDLEGQVDPQSTMLSALATFFGVVLFYHGVSGIICHQLPAAVGMATPTLAKKHGSGSIFYGTLLFSVATKLLLWNRSFLASMRYLDVPGPNGLAPKAKSQPSGALSVLRKLRCTFVFRGRRRAFHTDVWALATYNGVLSCVAWTGLDLVLNGIPGCLPGSLAIWDLVYVCLGNLILIQHNQLYAQFNTHLDLDTEVIFETLGAE